MVAGQAAEVGGRGVTGDGSFLETSDGGSVVAPVRQGGVSGVVRVTHHVCLADEPCLLKVTVGDSALGIVGGHKVVLHLLGERLVPDKGLTVGIEEHAAHASFGGVRGPQ